MALTADFSGLKSTRMSILPSKTPRHAAKTAWSGSLMRILVVGQTPPPYGGQTVMIQLLLDGAYNDIELVHVRMNFSKELKSNGRLKLDKDLGIV